MYLNDKQGRVVLLNGLVKQDVSLNYVDPSNPYLTPLIAASANGREECVRIILQCPGVQVRRTTEHCCSCRFGVCVFVLNEYCICCFG